MGCPQLNSESTNSRSVLTLYTYDNAGNPKNYMGKAMTWQNGNQLASVAGLNMQYDYAGMRTQKGSVRYFWQGDQLLAENNPNYNAFTYFYYDETGISGMKVNENNGLNYYFRKNIFGDVTDIYHSSGNWVGGYTYDAWGKTTIKPNSGWEAVVNPFRYRGYYQDEETGFYYLNSRYYDPEIGRFISPDNPELLPIMAQYPGGANLYSYCMNNPIAYKDESGEFALLTALIVGAIVGAVIGAGTSVVTQGITYGWDNINWGQVAFDGLMGGISGALSMSPMGIIGQIGWNAGLSVLSYGADCFAHGKDPTFAGTFMAAGLGGLFGGLGGKGAAPAGMRNLAGKVPGLTLTKAIGMVAKSAAVSGGTNIMIAGINKGLNKLTDGGWSEWTGLSFNSMQMAQRMNGRSPWRILYGM